MIADSAPNASIRPIIPSDSRKMNAAAFIANFTMSKPSKKPCGACARRRAKLVKILQRFRKGSRK